MKVKIKGYKDEKIKEVSLVETEKGVKVTCDGWNICTLRDNGKLEVYSCSGFELDKEWR